MNNIKGEDILAYTFRGGIHVNEYKLSSESPIELLPDPSEVRISMNQHIGTPAVVCVNAGDKVEIGRVIGDVPKEALGCPVHASVSGTVKAIESSLVSAGVTETYVVIESDGEGRLCDSVKPYGGSILDADAEKIAGVVRSAGITGMGGAAFPTYAKILSAAGKAELLIVNCAECEPFITSDHRVLLEKSAAVIGGVKTLMKAVGSPRAYVAIEDNKPHAIKKMTEVLENDSMIDVKIMKTKYPQGDERQLIFALTGRELAAGKLPVDAGCVIFNAATCAAVYEAFLDGTPLVRRVVTVSGDCVKEPKNLSVPIGTPASALAEYCGGFVKDPAKIVFGGPMMGLAQWDADAPVKKNTSSILFLSNEFLGKPSSSQTCIRCGRCVANCPMRLMPAYIAQSVMRDDIKGAERYGAMSCVECGCCSYNCPGKVEIVQYIRTAKNRIRSEAARSRSSANDK